jgi:NADH-quinone oxidoreductase subunit J
LPYSDIIFLAVYGLLGLVILFALLTVEFKDMIRAILSFAMMCILIGGVYWLIGAPLVAFFQILIYAGAIVVLFLISTMLVESR